MDEEEEIYGINKEYGHPNALALIPDEFFWDCVDEMAPFGSDEGDMALSEFREWRKENPEAPVKECIVWTIESVGEMDIADYNAAIADKNLIAKQLKDDDFNFEQYVNTLDISVIATGFGQLADEGKIDADAKPLIQIALDRQTLVNECEIYDKEVSDQYSIYLNRLRETLEKA